LRLRNMRYVRSGEIFEARVEDIPEAFRDTVIPLNPVLLKEAVEKKEEEILEIVKKTSNNYSIRPRATGTWVDVVDMNGKKINEKALKLSDAEGLLKKLNE